MGRGAPALGTGHGDPPGPRQKMWIDNGSSRPLGPTSPWPVLINCPACPGAVGAVGASCFAALLLRPAVTCCWLLCLTASLVSLTSLPLARPTEPEPVEAHHRLAPNEPNTMLCRLVTASVTVCFWAVTGQDNLSPRLPVCSAHSGSTVLYCHDTFSRLRWHATQEAARLVCHSLASLLLLNSCQSVCQAQALYVQTRMARIQALRTRTSSLITTPADLGTTKPTQTESLRMGPSSHTTHN